ncbi:beta-ketoacyl synthase N-terminal-like domain-containing protein [Kitasatospora sp. NPDC058406]|uniref:beta-ketoacyl synthase N-terminal-like domain-containing protein n=1 Tax=Kitasatospora sp. NPDC058406 TaxID=3346483 RepID=UPI00365B5F2E
MEAQREITAAAPTPLTRALDTVRKLRAQLDAANGTGPLAVVGIGLRLPGGIADLDGYWSALAEGRDLVRPLPEGRRGPFAAEWERLPHVGGFLDEVMDFDAEFFGMSAEEARGVDPQQRLLLEVAWEALENAALPPDRLDAARTGLFVGITGQEYWDWNRGEPDTHWAAGNGHCFTVGRLAYALGLAGPAVTVDTACSSSLVSVHLARQALARRECDVALAGGVNLVLSPRATRLHRLAGTLSPDGRCSPFDARANGFTRGEGCGVLVLKRLEDARRDGDRVHAVIHGSAVNQTGRSTGFTAPNVLSEAALIGTALADAGLAPADIGLVEAHGTGTPLGDTIEMEAIAAALGRRNGGAELVVGSVKANLGHPESAAGVVALVKAVLCLQRRAVPPLVHFATLNPLIDLDGTGITLPTALRPWPERGGRHAAVSAFGMGGTNAHVVLGAAEDTAGNTAGGKAGSAGGNAGGGPAGAAVAAVPVRGFVVSARTPEAVRALAAGFHRSLAALPDDGHYPAFAYTVGAGRARHRWQARVTAPDRASALRALHGLAEGGSPPGVVLAERDPGRDDADGADDGSRALPRAVVDLPNYPWQRRRHAPEPADGPLPVTGPVPAGSAVGGAAAGATATDPATAPAAGRERPAGPPLVTLEWARRDDDAGAPPAGPPGRWLLFADGTGVGEALRAEITARGGSCVTVTPGPHHHLVDPLHHEIDPLRPEDLTALLKEVRAAGDEPLTGLVYAWGLDTAGGPPPGGPGTFPPSEEQEGVALPALRLIEEFARDGLPGGPRVALLTRGAQRVVEGDPAPAPARALLTGPAVASAAALGGLRPVVVDLDPEPTRDDAARLLDLLIRPGDEPWTALRGPARHSPVPVPHVTPDGTEAAWPRRPFDPRRDPNHRILAVRPGILESLTPTRWERAAPGPGQVEIEVTAAGLNFSDVLKAMGAYPGATGTVPLGVECAGRISAVGEGVDRLRVGDPVMAVVPSALAAYTTTEAHLVAPRPAALDDEQAAATPVAFLTAVYGLCHLARLRAGEKVLIHSASGGVGLAALAVARRCGAEVLATAGTEEKRRFLRDLGVARVMDSRSLAFADEITGFTDGRGVDVVLNSLTGEALRRSLALLAPGGRFVELGKRDIHDDSPVGLGFLKRNRSLFAVDLEHTFHEQPALLAELFDEVVRGFDSGQFEPLPVTVHPFSEAREVFARMARARHTGKLVLRPDEAPEIAVPPARTVRAEASYLVTGGASAAALEAARQLADRGARRIVLVGAPSPGGDGEPDARASAGAAGAAGVLAELRSRGVEIARPVVDLSRAEEVADLLAGLDASGPPLAGVVHTGDAPDDGTDDGTDDGGADGTADGTADGSHDGAVPAAEALLRSTAARAAGAWQLHLATAARELDFFVLCSPTAPPGREAAVGAFLDALAAHRRALGLPALSVDREGVAALGRLLGSRAVVARVRPNGDAPAPDDADAIRRQLLAVEPGRRRRALLAGHCRDVAARVLGEQGAAPDAAAIDGTAPLAGLGFDSLRTLELRSRLELSLGVALPSTLGWQYPTLDALVPFLAERMGIALEAAVAAPPPVREPGNTPAATTGPRPGPDPALDLDELSERELEALLLARTEQFDASADPIERGQGR